MAIQSCISWRTTTGCFRVEVESRRARVVSCIDLVSLLRCEGENGDGRYLVFLLCIIVVRCQCSFLILEGRYANHQYMHVHVAEMIEQLSLL
jgi:hypothetical protein